MSYVTRLVEWIAGQSEAKEQLFLSQTIPFDKMVDAISLYINGVPLRELQHCFDKPMQNAIKLPTVRKFVRYWVNDIAYGIGLIGQFIMTLDHPHARSISYYASQNASLIREGVDSKEKLALLLIMRQNAGWTRVRAHLEAEKYLPYIEPQATEFEDMRDTMGRVSKVLTMTQA